MSSNERMPNHSTITITSIGPHDVLCGRGAGRNTHPGNIKFRKLVAEHKLRHPAASRADKSREVVEKWRSLDPPGRFLAKVNDGEDNTHALWYDVGDKKAMDKALRCLSESNGTRKGVISNGRIQSKKTFVLKLMQVLSAKDCQNAIRWMPTGNAFCILDVKELVEVILPKFGIKETKYSSFTRKLNRWGFKNCTPHSTNKGQVVAIYYHEMFLRDRPDMCNGMTAGGSGPEDDDTLMNNAAMTMAQNDSLITLSILQQQQQMMMMACGSVGYGNLIQQQQAMAQAPAGEHTTDSKRKATESDSQDQPISKNRKISSATGDTGIEKQAKEISKSDEDFLNKWMSEHSTNLHPTKEEREKIISTTGLSLKQLDNWLCKARTEQRIATGKKSYEHLPKESIDTLNKWFKEHESNPYPTITEKAELMTATGLSERQLKNWFTEARKKQSEETGVPTKTRQKLSEEDVDYLKYWFAKHSSHPYPTKEDVKTLALATGLTHQQVKGWFVRARENQKKTGCEQGKSLDSTCKNSGLLYEYVEL